MSAGMFEVNPAGSAPYGDDWYFEGRYAASIGRYWTENLKTELEFATSGEGRRYVQDTMFVPGVPQPYPYSYEQFHRVMQTTARVVYQFGDNTWVHPWVSAGVVHEADRQRRHLPPLYQYGVDLRNPRVLQPEHTTATDTNFHFGGSVGGGSKFYVSTNSYINTGLIFSYTRPTTTVTLLAGFGVEF